MNHPSRLFDCLQMHLENGADHVMLAGKENGAYKEYSVAETAKIVDQLSAGLLLMGFGKGDGTPEGRDKIAVIAKNRPEWVFLDLAVQKTGAVLTPIYPTVGEPELEFILRDAKVKIIFVNDDTLMKKIDAVKERLPDLRIFYSFDPSDAIPHWKSILDTVDAAHINKVNEVAATIRNEDLATIIYTSGTTGDPKGVMLSHNNILSNVMDSMECFPPGTQLKALSFLPLNHIFERMVSFIYLFKGTSIYFAESLEAISDNLREVQPHMFTTVPRLLEKVYEKIMSKGDALTGIKRKLFFWAHSLATKFEINKDMGWWYRFQLKLANKIIFKKWRQALGNNILCIISGGAACQVRLIRIFTAAEIIIMEGYGLTETSPVISVNRYQEQNRMFGTVGPLIKNVEVKIANDGEILCKGPNIMVGYYKHPEMTDEVMEGAWFKTGDIGTMVEGKYLKITDRKKEMFKTSGGKYVAPGVVENKMKESQFIETIMVIGADQKYVTALIVPSFENLQGWCKERALTYENNMQMVNLPEVKLLFKNVVDKYNDHFNHVEQIKKFTLLSTPWSVETGELTPKLSLRRKVILEKNREDIQQMYAQTSQEMTP